MLRPLRSRRLWTLVAVPAAALFIATSAFAAKPPWTEKVTVCHEAGNSGRTVELSVPRVAWENAFQPRGATLAVYGYCP